MNIIECQQNTPEWVAVRAKHFTASEAPAMLGLSKYMTRTELLRQKATGISPKVDSFTQAAFDQGHAAEAAARSIVEEIIGDELYSCVGTLEVDGLPLLASFDGLNMNGDLVWETKLWSEELAEAIAGEDLSAHYWAQMECQLLVSGAEKVYFTASDGTKENTIGMWYASRPERRAQLIAGWKQFGEDMKNYTPPEIITAAVATPQMQLPAVSVQVTGGVAVADNLALFGDALRAHIERINRQPATDQDFADLEATVKTLKTAEEALESAKSNALGQVASIDLMKRTADQLQELARANRLTVEKLVRAEKENRRNAIIRAGHDAIEAFVAAANGRIGRDYMPRSVPYFAEAVKGLKTISSIQNAVDTELARCKITASEAEARITTNLATLRSLAADVPFLLHDTATIIQKAPDDLTALVKARIAEHKAAKAMNMEIEREKIRQEEEAKVEEIAGAASGLSDVLCVTKDELLDLLEYIFVKYENGPACYENPDDYDGYLGNAILIDDAEFQRIADILNAHRPQTCNTAN